MTCNYKAESIKLEVFFARKITYILYSMRSNTIDPLNTPKTDMKRHKLRQTPQTTTMMKHLPEILYKIFRDN